MTVRSEASSRARPPAIGALLRYRRRARNLSQLDLATQAEISSRHLCFVETGRAKPSREMVLLLADALDVPLRERNEWLAAGFAPGFAESALEAPSLSGVSQAIDAILAQQEPFPAVVMDRGWDIVRANAAAARFFGFLLGERREGAPNNVLRLFFHPGYVKPYVVNWEQVIRSLAQRARREALASGAAPTVLEEVLSYPGVPSFSSAAEESPQQPVLPVEFHKEGRTFRFFSAITTLGTPQDITLQELRIESFFPSDEATRSAAHQLSAGD